MLQFTSKKTILFELKLTKHIVLIFLNFINNHRHLDTSYLDVDVQPLYVRVSIKGKCLQLTLPFEVSTEKSFVKRNTTTGHLIIMMPQLNPSKTISANKSSKKEIKVEREKLKTIKTVGATITKRELLEIGPPRDDLDFSKIAIDSKKRKGPTHLPKLKNSQDFVDDPEVPPLE